MDEVGRSALYLISDLSSGVTGEIHYCDGGYNHIGVPKEHANNTVFPIIITKKTVSLCNPAFFMIL